MLSPYTHLHIPKLLPHRLLLRILQHTAKNKALLCPSSVKGVFETAVCDLEGRKEVLSVFNMLITTATGVNVNTLYRYLVEAAKPARALVTAKLFTSEQTMESPGPDPTWLAVRQRQVSCIQAWMTASALCLQRCPIAVGSSCD